MLADWISRGVLPSTDDGVRTWDDDSVKMLRGNIALGIITGEIREVTPIEGIKAQPEVRSECKHPPLVHHFLYSPNIITIVKTDL